MTMLGQCPPSIRWIYPACLRFTLSALVVALTACGGSDSGGDTATPADNNTTNPAATAAETTYFMVSATTSGGGSISPASIELEEGESHSFVVTANDDHAIAAVTGCGGEYRDGLYVIPAVTEECTVSAEFTPLSDRFFEGDVTLTPKPPKTFHFSWPETVQADEFRLLENATGQTGYELVATIAGDQNDYAFAVPLALRTEASYILQACSEGECADSEVILVEKNLESAIGQMALTQEWQMTMSDDASILVLHNDYPDNQSAPVQIHEWIEGQWQHLQTLMPPADAGDDFGRAVALSPTGHLLVVGTGTNALIYGREGNRWQRYGEVASWLDDEAGTFGHALAFSASGKYLAVGAPWETPYLEDGQGEYTSSGVTRAGAVYLFALTPQGWQPDSYILPQTLTERDEFGHTLALSENGDTLVVGAARRSASVSMFPNTGICDTNPEECNRAAFAFTRVNGNWRETPLEVEEVGFHDRFGAAVEVSADGTHVLVTAPPINRVYAFSHQDGEWELEQTLTPRRADEEQYFGSALSLSANGEYLAVASVYERNPGRGINPDSGAEPISLGAVTLFRNAEPFWLNPVYIKPSIAMDADVDSSYFGKSVHLSADGGTLAIRAEYVDPSDIQTAIYLY